MFGLKGLFLALSRLTAEIQRAADLFRAANENLAERLGFDEETPALDHRDGDTEERPTRNGRKAKA